MVTIEPPVRMGQHSWKLKYSSDLPEPMFYIYLDGNLIAETQQTEYDIAVNLEEVSLIEILDDPDTPPMQVFPGKAKLGWFFVEGTEHYRVDEYIGEEWIERRRLPENKAYLKWESRFLEDGQTHLFRVVPVGTNGNEGTAKQFAVLMVRRPDVNYSHDKDTNKIVIHNTELPPVIYNVTGEIVPDATCNYFYAGVHNDKPYYRGGDGVWRIFLYLPWNQWLIGTSFGYCDACWAKPDDIITGEYPAVGEGFGVATVAKGIH